MSDYIKTANSGVPGLSGLVCSASAGTSGTVSVAVICHNYGRFLAAALSSVLAQTLRPIEVLVIDDDSDDETADVAREFSCRGVRYMRVSNRSAWENRLLAARVLKGRWLLCLDADNEIPESYLESGVEAGERSATCGIVRCDLDQFGDVSGLVRMNSEIPIHVVNSVDAGALYRREAILQLEPSEPRIDPRQTAEDWVLARRVIENGWSVEQNATPLRYRRHPGQKHASRLAADRRYFVDAGLASETVTIFIPLSGRSRLWDVTRSWLDSQKWPRKQCRLVLCDNSHDRDFGLMVRRWAADSSYEDVRYYVSRLGANGLSDRPRADHVANSVLINQVVAAHYNRLPTETQSEYLFVLEDDVDPPEDAIERLMRGIDSDVAAVTGAYQHRDGRGWLAWTGPSGTHDLIEQKGSGLQDIDGCGWGCLLVRKSSLSQTRLTSDGKTIFYDVNWSGFVRESGQRLRIDWGVVCEHHAGSL